ncbi:MAG: lysophospholipid acyltransferase family protein [Legionellaceae bacterium]|nr:lysophospholipid acyltransferase family protein [Legionellaceae bacterium]
MSELAQKIQSLPVSWMGHILYHMLPWRRKIVQANIKQAFGQELDLVGQQKLAKAFYTHLACSLKEMISMRFLSTEQLRARVEVKGYDQLLAEASKGKGVLILTGHFGNWEFAPIGGILNFEAFQGQFHFIRKTLGGAQWIEKILFRRYFQAGLKVIPKKNSLQQVCDALDHNHAVVFVLDQHACLGNRDGVAAEFFGRKAGTYRSLASLARHTGVAVIPAASYRLPNQQHVLEFLEPLNWEEKDSLQEAIYHNTCRYNQALEQIICAHPEQWLWFHKRWKIKDN